MNHIYKVIFNKSTGTFMAVTEYARAAGKGSTGAVGSAKSAGKFTKGLVLSALSAAVMMASGVASAAVVDGTAVGGNATAAGSLEIHANTLPPAGYGNIAITTTTGNGGSASLQPNKDGQIFIGNIKANADLGGSVAIGADVQVGGGFQDTHDVAIGYKANAAGGGSITLGAFATGDANNGQRSLTDTTGNVTIGFGANTGINAASGATAIGTAAQVLSNNSVGIGNEVYIKQGSGVNQVSIGYLSTSASENSIALGQKAFAGDSTIQGQDGVTAIGSNARAVSTATIAIGKASMAGGYLEGNKATIDANLVAAQSAYDAAKATLDGWQARYASGDSARAAIEADPAQVAAFAEAAIAHDRALEVLERAKADQAMLLSEGQADARNAIAVGNLSQARNRNATAIGLQSNARGVDSIAMGSQASTAIGAQSATAIGHGARTEAQNSIAMGTNALVPLNNRVGVAGGNVAHETINSVAIGNNARVVDGQKSDGTNGYQSSNAGAATLGGATAIGHNARTAYGASVAVGAAHANAINSIAMGAWGNTQFGNFYAETRSEGSLAIGNQARVNENAVGSQAIGRGATILAGSESATGHGSVALGQTTTTQGRGAVAIGGASAISAGAAIPRDNAAVAGADNALAISSNAHVYGGSVNGIALGNGARVGAGAVTTGTDGVPTAVTGTTIAENGIAIGKDAQVLANNSIAVGVGNVVTGANSGAFGDPTTISGTGSYSVGNDNNISADKTFVVGSNVVATADNNVILGADSAETSATITAGAPNKVDSATVAGVTYGGFAGDTEAAGIVSVGSTTATRQITNVAPGTISATSTDAINGSQLHLITEDMTLWNQGNTAAIGGGAKYDPATNTYTAPTFNIVTGTTNPATAGNSNTNFGQPATTVAGAIENLNTYVNQGFNVRDNGNAIKGVVTPGENIQFVNGTNTTSNVTQEADGTTKVTFNVTMPTATITQNSGTGRFSTTDAGNNLVTAANMVTSLNNTGFFLDKAQNGGTATGDPADKKIANGDTFTLTAGENITINQIDNGYEISAKTGNATTVTGGNGTTVTNVGTPEEPNYQVIARVDGDTINFNSAGQITANTTNYAAPTTAGTVGAPTNPNALVNAKTVADAINNSGFNVTSGKTGTGTANGTTTELVNPGETVTFQAGDNMVVTQANGVFTYATAKDVVFDSVKAGDINAGDKLTVGNPDTNNAPVTITSTGPNEGTITGLKTTLPTGVTNAAAPTNPATNNAATIGDVLNAGWNLQTNSTALDLVKPYDTVNFVDGQGTTVKSETDGTTSKIQVDIKTDGTTTEINDQGQLVAKGDGNTVTTVEQGEGTTVTNTGTPDAPVYNVAVNTDGDTIKIEGGKVTANTSPLTNVAAGQPNAGSVEAPAQPNALVTAQTVADAINNSGFNVTSGKTGTGTANGTTTELVNPGETVTFQAGDNMVVTQANGVFTYATAKDVVFDSVKAGDINAGDKLTVGNPDTNNAPVTITSTGPNEGTITGLKTTLPTGVTNAAAPTNPATNNAATIGDVLNAGWNLQTNSTALDLVKPYDTVNFVDGQGTTVKSETDGTTSKIQVDIKTDGTTTEINDQGQLVAKGDGNTVTTVEQGEGTTVTNTGTPDAPVYNVAVNTDGDTIKIEGGKVTANTSPLTNVAAGQPNAGSVEAPAQPNALVTAQTVADAINNSGFNVTSGKTGTGTANGTTTELVNPGETVTFQAGDNMVVTQANGVFTYATAKDVVFDSVKAGDINAGDKLTVGNPDTNNAPVTITSTGPNEGTITGLKTTLPTGVTNAAAPTNPATNNAATIGDVLNAGWNLQTNSTALDLVKPYDTVNFVDGQGTTVKSETDGTTSKIQVDIKTDGTTTEINDQGQLVAKGDGNTVTTVEQGEGTTVTNTGTPDAPVYNVAVNTDGDTIKIEGGKVTANTSPLTNVAAGQPNAGSVEAPAQPNALVTAQTVADAINNSGFNVTSGKTGTGTANGTTTELVNPGETVTFQAGDNMVVTQANGVFTYATAKDVVFDSVTSNSVTIPTTNGGSPIVINEAGINAGNNKITNVAPGTAPTDAATVGQLPTVVAGNGVQVTEGTNATGGKQYTVSATATPVNVEIGDVNVDLTTGKATGTGEGDKNLTDANTVADAINNAGFKVAQNGEAQPDLVNAGDTVDFVDGKNTTASVTTTPTGTTVTFDVKEATIATPAQTGPEAGKLAAPAEDGVVTANNLVEAINNSGFNVTSGAVDSGVANGTTTELVNPGETVTFQAGDNMVVTQAGNVFTYATAKDVTFDSVNADTVTVGGNNPGNTSPVTITAGNTPNSGTISGLATFLPNPAATAQPAPANLANAPVNNAATLGDVLNSGWNLQRGGAAVDFVNPYDTVNFEAGRNVTLDHRTDGKTSTIVINATAPAAVAGTTVEAGDGIVVTQAGDVVTISADTVPLTTVDGVTVTPASPNKLATAGDVANAINNAGFKVAENGTAQPDLVNAGDTVDFVDGNLTTARVTTTPAGATVTFDVNAQDVVEDAQLPVVYTDAAGNKLYKQPDGTFNTAPDGTGTPVQPENVVASMNNGAGSTTAPMTLGNVASTLPNTYNTDALNPNGMPVTTSQALPALTPAQLNNAATVGDVLNAGFNVQNNGAARDFVKPYDTVNFVNGAGTTAVVETNPEGTVSNVRYDVNYDNLTINGQTVTQNPDGTYSFNVTGGTGAGGLAAGPDAASAQPVNSTVVNGVGTTATVTPQVDADGNTVNVVKVDSPMAYVNEAAPADTSTPTNTTTLVGGDAAAPVQVLNVASALRNASNPSAPTTISDMTAAMQSPSTANNGNTNVAVNLDNLLTAANIAKTEVTSNDGSVGITSSTGANGQTIYDLRVAGGANVDLSPVHKRIDDVEDDANAGVSSAMAMAALPQAYLPGKSMLTGGMATYNGEGAVAVGLSKLSDNGRWVLKISGSADTQGNAGAAVGAGFHF